jgi:hypothetical protein
MLKSLKTKGRDRTLGESFDVPTFAPYAARPEATPCRFESTAYHGRLSPWFLICVVATLCLVALSSTSVLQAQEAKIQQAGKRDFFGARSQTDAALIGIFYDFKQTQTGQKINRDYRKVIEQFLNQGWDESVLKEFYRSTQPLYTTQVFIPYIDADNAPRAFGVDQRVKPSQWMVHYKGQVSSNTGGTFRFIGLADDILAVGVNSETVLVAPIRNAKYAVDWKPSEGPETSGPCGPMKFGTWFTVKKDEVIDLDILVGEVPGGGFGAWLQIEEKGVTYKAERAMHTKFPVFQLVPQTFDPEIYKWGKVPMYSAPGPSWKAIP